MFLYIFFPMKTALTFHELFLPWLQQHIPHRKYQIWSQATFIMNFNIFPIRRTFEFYVP